MSPKPNYDRVELIHEDQVIDPIVKANPLKIEINSFSVEGLTLLCAECKYHVVTNRDGIWVHNLSVINEAHNVKRILVTHD